MRHFTRLLFCSLALTSLVLVSRTQAASPNRFVTTLAGRTPGEGKTLACFARDYDAAHLAAHPHQNVASIHALVVVYSNMDYGYQLRIGLHLRDNPEALSTVAECGNGEKRDKLQRAAICAGIGGHVLLAVENRNFVQLSIPRSTGLWHSGPPQPNNLVQNAFGEDDRHIRLRRAPLAQCVDQALDDQEKALLAKDR